MNFCGLTDSVAAISSSPRECPICHAASHVAHGLCLGCLLQTGVTAESSDATGFAEALDEIAIPDTQWRLGNYEILEEIGRGGMGVIYRARQRHSRRIVALKRVLSYHADSRETLARFRREAEAAASLDHPNILPIYEVGETDEGVPYFSMKYAPGGSLQEGALSLRHQPRESVRLLAKVARAVQYAHRQGILHRDLKPGNILLDGQGEPLVSDFGLAKWLDASSDLTRTLTIFGTPGYIAPEQAEGPAANLKPTADVYSLGAILFDLLAGRPPFLGEHALAVIRQAAEKPAPKLRSLVEKADRDLETICARCLEREPAARYHSAGDLAEDLERWLEGRPIIARPVSPPAQLWRWSRRNPVLAGSLVACLVFGAAAVVWRTQSRRLGATVIEQVVAMHSVAVLPFLDLETTLPDQTLASKVAATLERAMSQRGPCRVNLLPSGMRKRTSSASIADVKNASQVLHARAVLSGTRRIVGQRTRITFRLMNGGTGDVLITRAFEGNGIQDATAAITRNNAKSIYAVLDRADLATASVSARDPGLSNERTRELIESGRELHFRHTLPDFDRAISSFETVLKVQPKSAIAHAYLSSSLGGRSNYISDGKELDRAESEAREAVRLASDSGEGHRALTGVMYLRGNIKSAVQEALNAVEAAGPDEMVAALLGASYATLGRPDRGLAWYQIARHCETRPGEYDSLIGDCWSALLEDGRAEACYLQATELHPDRPHGWVGICRLHFLRNELDQARATYLQNSEQHRDHIYARQIAAQLEFFTRNFANAGKLYTELLATDPGGGGGFYGAVSYDSALARLAVARGDMAAAEALLSKSRTREVSASKGTQPDADVLYRLAAIESVGGDRSAALLRLHAAVAAGWIDYRSLALDPRFDQVRGDSDFETILDDLRSKVASMRLSETNYIKEQ
jgi:tetratricopeptide (TPR) repeat protein/tRNA A-37 threonylcarbamoyl transferase component Bud32